MKNRIMRMAAVCLMGGCAWMEGVAQQVQPDEPEGREIQQFPITYEPGRPLTAFVPDPDTIKWADIKSRPGYRYRGMLPLHRQFYNLICAKRRAGEPLTPGELNAIRLLQSIRRWPEAPVPGLQIKAFLRYLRNLPTRDLNIAQSVMLARVIHLGLYPLDYPRNPGAQRMVNHLQSGPFEPRNWFERWFGRVEPWMNYQYATCGYDMRPPTAGAGSIFPATPFNGMQIAYAVGGAGLSAPVDKDGFTTTRTLKGILTGDALILGGNASMERGWGADVTVRLYAGTEERTWTNALKPSASCTFSLSVPRPKGVTSGGFRIEMAGSFSMAGAGSSIGGRGLVVSGTFEQSPEEKNRDDAEARKAWDAEVERTLKELGYEDTPEGRRLKEMREALAGGDAGWRDYVNRTLKDLGYEDTPEHRSFVEMRDALVGGCRKWQAYVAKTSPAAAKEGVGSEAPDISPEEGRALQGQSAWNFGSTAALKLTSPATVKPGAPISVEFSGIPEASRKQAWIGLFKADDGPRKSIRDAIVPNLDGAFEVEAPDEPGLYNVRLFYDETGREVASTAIIEVAD